MSTEQTTQYATFVVADLFFGIDVLRVQEVLRYQEMTRIPLAPTVAAGLINLRGQIVDRAGHAAPARVSRLEARSVCP